ncbi:MAG TPA: hypothetical protein VK662_00465 [Acidothermaceae bacterium]|nr:hypothetical protein [Acidothermaceae bacterium]
MVPDDYSGYFTAAASAAGALIGLLFVAVSLRPDDIFGDATPGGGRALASSSFTGLVNGFFLSMAALIPGKNLGVSAAVLAVFCISQTLRLHRSVGTARTSVLTSVASVAIFVVQLAAGIGLTARPHNVTFVKILAWVTITSFTVALLRAWALLKGKTAPPDAKS